MSATASQYRYTVGRLGVQACLAAASGKSLLAKPCETPFAALLGD